MPTLFPSPEWVQLLHERLNASAAYAAVARTWEGDLFFVIERPGGGPVRLYLDLWHGQCRASALLNEADPDRPAAFRLSAPFGHFKQILLGQLDPMQAMMTGKLKVQGNMLALMKNIPTVLEFVRTAQQIPTEFPAD